MKSMENKSVRAMRRQAVVESFFGSLKELRKTKPFVSQSEVIEHACKSSAPRFFVTFENARRFVSLLMRGKELPITNKNKLAMYMEIYNRYCERIKECDSRYKYVILESIIEEPAPSFYLDEETFRGIVYTTLRSRCKKGSTERAIA